jgi:hypothetical protein
MPKGMKEPPSAGNATHDACNLCTCPFFMVNRSMPQQQQQRRPRQQAGGDSGFFYYSSHTYYEEPTTAENDSNDNNVSDVSGDYEF